MASYVLRTIIMLDRQPKSYQRRSHARLETINSSRSLKIGCEPYIANCVTALGCPHWISINSSQPSFLVPYSFSSPIFSWSSSNHLTQLVPQPTLMYPWSQSFLSLPTSQRQFSYIHTVTSRRTNLLSSTFRITGSDIPIRCEKAAAMKLHFPIGDSDVQKISLPFDIHAALARFPSFNFTRDMLEIHAVIKKQSSSKLLFWLDIKHVRIANSGCVRSAIVPNQQGPFQVSTSVLCISFVVANSIKACIVHVLARWIFARETPGFNLEIMDIVELCSGQGLFKYRWHLGPYLLQLTCYCKPAAACYWCCRYASKGERKNKCGLGAVANCADLFCGCIVRTSWWIWCHSFSH